MSGVEILREIVAFMKGGYGSPRPLGYGMNPIRSDADTVQRSLVIEVIEEHWLPQLEAKAEKPAEPVRCERCRWPLAEEAKNGCVPGNCSKRPLPKPPKDRKGDEVLRDCVEHYSYDPVGPVGPIGKAALLVLCRRALGEGGEEPGS